MTPGREFVGAWFSGYSDSTVKFNLYSGGLLVATSSPLTASSTPTFLASGYSGSVDAVGVYSTKNGDYVMDDVTYRVRSVPEPASFLMCVVGSAGMWVYARRRAKKPVTLALHPYVLPDYEG